MVRVAKYRDRVKGEWFDTLFREEVLSGEWIEAACRQVGHRWRASFWSPTMTLITFLLQVLDGPKTLRSAVAAMLTQWAGRV